MLSDVNLHYLTWPAVLYQAAIYLAAAYIFVEPFHIVWYYQNVNIVGS